MTKFSVRNRSEATVNASPERIWSVLVDPAMLVRYTPNIRKIDANGDVWVWYLSRVSALGHAVEPSFTEIMEFDEPRRIGFRHDDTKTDERAGVDGEYVLEPVAEGTHVLIDLGIWVDLPLPRMSRRLVEPVMHGVVSGMGYRFAQNLRHHLES